MIKELVSVKFSVCLTLFLLISCSKPTPLENALTLAGPNRGELEKVLANYSQNPGDSLKYKAACFLIENMPGHYSYEDTTYLNKYYNEIDSLASIYRGKEEYEKLYEEILSKYAQSQKLVYDIHVITAQYLINNIDSAFSVWENALWAQHIDFDEFCEYILPYKVEDKQALDNWREYFSYDYNKLLDILQYSDVLKNLATPACQRIIYNLHDSIQMRINTNVSGIPVRRMKTLIKIPYGPCDDYSSLVTAVMRAKGIPVAIDYTPQWPFRSMGHVWNVLLINYGKNVSFNGIDADIKNYHREDHTMAKIFRRTYKANQELIDLLLSERYIPKTFQNQFIKDVTDEYLKTVDVEIPLKNGDHKYVYLSVFDDADWFPIHWAKVQKDKAIFKNMGKNIAYLPVAYNKSGNMALSNPIIIDAKGRMRNLVPDTINKRTMVVRRKFPVFNHMHAFIQNIKDIEIQASDNPLFRNAVSLDTTKNYGINTEEVIFDSIHTYRYWRFYKKTPGGGNINVAEILFFEKGSENPSYGRVIGTEGSWHNRESDNKEAAFDGDALTIFDAPFGEENWVGMDFGEPVAIEKIIYLPRSDGNLIELCDEYELVYWQDKGWKSLGRQIAKGASLTFENCPDNALFLLHNHTKGKEERIFTYEDDKQIWW